jgi:hypothetical protein
MPRGCGRQYQRHGGSSVAALRGHEGWEGGRPVLGLRMHQHSAHETQHVTLPHVQPFVSLYMVWYLYLCEGCALCCGGERGLVRREAACGLLHTTVNFPPISPLLSWAAPLL